MINLYYILNQLVFKNFLLIFNIKRKTFNYLIIKSLLTYNNLNIFQ